jgi:hypothetical protein
LLLFPLPHVVYAAAVTSELQHELLPVCCARQRKTTTITPAFFAFQLSACAAAICLFETAAVDLMQPNYWSLGMGKQPK